MTLMTTNATGGRAKHLMVFLLLAFMGAVLFIAYLLQPEDPVESVAVECGATLEACQAAYEQLRADNRQLGDDLADLGAALDRAREEEADEVIVLSDAAGFSFASGSANPGSGLSAEIVRLTQPAGDITRLVDLGFEVMVTGHTDSTLMGSGCTRDADRRLRDGAPPSSIRACDNSGLSLQRALVVRDLILDRLPEAQVIATGAGFSDPSEGTCSQPVVGNNNPCDRRVEIRLIRLQ